MGSCESCLGSCYPFTQGTGFTLTWEQCIADPSNCLPELLLGSQIDFNYLNTWSSTPLAITTKQHVAASAPYPFCLLLPWGAITLNFLSFSVYLTFFFITLMPFLWHRVNGKNIYLTFLFQDVKLAPSLKRRFFFLLKNTVNRNLFSWVLGRKQIDSNHSVLKQHL